MGDDVVGLAHDVIKIIQTELDPTINKDQRAQAYRMREEFKNTSPLCCEVGFYMFDKTQHNLDTVLRKCGLQFVEWAVLNTWDKVEAEWRQQMKVKCLKLIECADFGENMYIKEGVVKIVVEVIKRSWPQEWESLFSDLFTLHLKGGEAQLELVLIILMRLSEDINPLNGLDEKVKQQRKKDMVNTLNKEIPNLLKFLITTIHTRTLKLKETKDESHLRIVSAVLFTITEFSSWVNFRYLLAEDKVLFQVLFLLLELDETKLGATNCLCTIFERKTEAEMRGELMVILSDDALSIIEKVARVAASQACEGDEDAYNVLKQLAEMISNFGLNQIANLWGNDKGFKERPPCFDRFLKLLLDFSKLDSMTVISSIMKMWAEFSRHPLISEDQVFISAIHLLPEDILRIVLIKIYGPNATGNSPACMFSSLDFDEEAEFKDVYNSTRMNLGTIMKKITKHYPLDILKFIVDKAKIRFSEIPDLKGINSTAILSTIHYILLDAFLHLCKFFSNSFFELSQKEITEAGLHQINIFIKSLIDWPSPHPVYTKQIIQAMEIFFPIFQHSQEMLVPSIQKLSSLMHAITDDMDQRAYMKLRREAVGILANLLKKKPQLLVANFDEVQGFFSQKVNENVLSNLEKSFLIEGLISVCKLLEDAQKRKTFIEDLLMYALGIFNKEEVKDALTDTKKFINYLGLGDTNITDVIIQHRKDFGMAIYTLHSALRTINNEEDKFKDFPNDEDMSKLVAKIPGNQLLIDSIPIMFDIAQHMNLLWTKVGDFPPCFAAALGPYVLEMNQPTSAKSQTSATATTTAEEDEEPKKDNKHFLVYNTFEMAYHSLSLYGRCLSCLFYSLPGMMDVFIEKVALTWVHLPNYRMKKVWKDCVNRFLLQCPLAYYDNGLGRLFGIALNEIVERFTREWPRIKAMEESQNVKSKSEVAVDDSDQSPEIIESRIMSVLSNEVFTVLSAACQHKKGGKSPDPKEGFSLGPLGEKLLVDKSIGLKLLTFFLSSLTWPEGSAVDKVCKPNFLILLMSKVFGPGNPLSHDFANQIMMQVLQGLQMHGGDPGKCSSIVNTAYSLYVHLRQQYPDIVHIMMMIPTCKEEQLKQFDLDVFLEDTTVVKLNETTKRRRFRKLIEGAVGKTVSQLYKADLKISDLVPLAPRKKPKQPDVIADGEDNGLCQLFDPTGT